MQIFVVASQHGVETFLYLDPDSARYKLLYDLGIGFITSLSLRSPICKIRIIKPTLQGFCGKNKTSVKYLEQKRHSVKTFAIIIIIFSITTVIILYFFPFCKFQPWQWRKKRPVPSQLRRWGL